MRKFTKEEFEFVKNCLEQHVPKHRFIKDVLHTDGRVFQRMCEESGLGRYPNFRKNKVWDNPFENINDPEVQYWLGWLATDGTVQTVGEKRCSLRLQDKDRDVIEKFNTFLGGNLTISTVKQHNKFLQTGLSFRNERIVSFLEKLGFNNNKTFTFDPQFKITWDYIRGCFEGDGYLRWGKTCEFSILTASIKHLRKLERFFKRFNFNIKIKKLKNRKSDIYQIGCYRKKEIIQILDNLYKDADTFMNRKYALARSISNSAWKPLKFGEPASGIPSEAQEIGNV